MHVLTIPSWYPLDDNDMNGSFFRDYFAMHSDFHTFSGLIAPQLIAYRSKQITKTRYLAGIHYNDTPGPSIRFAFPNLPQSIKPLYHRTVGLFIFRKYLEIYGRPDIIHVHSMIWGGYLALEIKKRYGIPYILTEHNSRYVGNGKLSSKEKQASKMVIMNADHVVAVSEFMRDELIKMFDYQKYITVIPNLVKIHRSTHPSSERAGIISVCHLNKNKRIDLLLKSYAMSKSKLTHQLTIVGAGSEKSHLEDLARQLGIAKDVNFLGELSNEAVAQHLSKSALFVSCSRFETFGVALVEALTNGVPVITTPSGGPSGFVKSYNGIYLNSDDPSDISDAIDKVLENHDTYDNLLIASNAMKNFSPDAIGKIYSSLFMDVVNS